MDDCVLVFKEKKGHTDIIFNYLNTKHNISFTVYLEVDNQLPFLDVIICRGVNGLVTDVYRKTLLQA